jgi:DNA-binding NarL/FixJ family response regulator
MAGRCARILVLYRHPLLGQGLAEILSREASLEIRSVDEGDPVALRDALGSQPDVIIFEEGGPVEPLDMLRRSGCALLIDVSIATSDAWTIRRDAITTVPGHVTEAILEACSVRAKELVAG